jgi:hypothetical protein
MLCHCEFDWLRANRWPHECRFQFQKRSQNFIGAHNKPPIVITLCGHDPKLSALVVST